MDQGRWGSRAQGCSLILSLSLSLSLSPRPILQQVFFHPTRPSVSYVQHRERAVIVTGGGLRTPREIQKMKITGYAPGAMNCTSGMTK